MKNIAIIVVPEKPQVDVAAREIFSTELDALTPGIKGLSYTSDISIQFYQHHSYLYILIIV